MNTTFKHTTWGSITHLRAGLAEAIERDPRRLEAGLPCEGCGVHVPATKCVWCELEGGGVTVTDRACLEPEKSEPVAKPAPEPSP